jgi:hypothetical protein
VYVPVYEPTVVYGPWWYPAYPPYYWPYPGAAFVNGFFWGAGVAVAASIWGWNHFDWRRRDIDINVNKWNDINVRGAKISSNTWRHDPAHRGPVPYRDKATRDKFGQASRARDANKDFRGFDRDGMDRAKIESRLKETDHAGVKDRAREAGRAPAELRDRPASKAGDRRPDRAVPRGATTRPSPAAFDVRRGTDVRKFADRGHASRGAMQHRSSARPNVGRSGGRRR